MPTGKKAMVEMEAGNVVRASHVAMEGGVGKQTTIMTTANVPLEVTVV